jgi:hypothetical protein
MKPIKAYLKWGMEMGKKKEQQRVLSEKNVY